MAKDMENLEIREYNGKKYKYVEQETLYSDIDWEITCCEGCSLIARCSESLGFKDIEKHLGNCFEEVRKDGRNGIFEEVTE
jgi:hypothetical protein